MRQFVLTLLMITGMVVYLKAQTAEERLRDQLDSISRQNGLRGFGVSVFSTDSLYFQEGYGYADIKAKKPYKTNTVQNIGSISKTFIGVSLMKAVELGKFTMDTPVNDILPFKVAHPKFPRSVITIKHLATHTSGIIDFEKGYDQSYVLEDPNSITPEIYGKEMSKYLKQIKSNKAMPLATYLEGYLIPKGSLFHKKNFLKSAPGEKYEYSNVASALAAYCIEVATGQSFPEFTRQYIFNPVGMQDTGWSYDAIDPEKQAQVYANNGQPLPAYSLNTYPDGGLRTSIESLTKYMRAIMLSYQGDNTLLRNDLSKEMIQANVNPTQYGDAEETDSYGYFWEYNRDTVIGHNGGDPGILTLMYYYKDIEMGAVFFTNTNVIDNPIAAKQVQACWNAIRTYQKAVNNNKI